MRVGLVCPYDMGIPGGVQDQVLRLSRWVVEAGHDVVVIGPGECDVPGFVSAGPSTVVPANGAATPVALSRYASSRLLAGLADVDVAHVHEPLMPQVSLTALRKATVPMVGTFHADVSVPVEWVYRLGRPATSRWFRRLKVITAVSPIAARVVAATNRVRIIPNGIDHDAYAPVAKVPGSVAFLGRNDQRKGLPVLLEAWTAIKTAHPAATLTVIGSTDTVDMAGVRFVGRVSEEEKRRRLAESSVFVAPNISGESFGIVVVEAMAAGCALVASGLPAFVRVAGDAARFVAPGDAGGLGHEVVALLGDEAMARNLGERARAASARFGREVVAAAYLGAYEDALAKEGMIGP
jgi:phosphatidylinositol alpha-mannosyltransferase